MKQGISHTVECTCILPQYMNAAIPVYHKFIVFSIVEDDVVIPKFVQCDNCGVIHHITEIGRSKIHQGRDELRSIMNISDITSAISPRLADVLSANNCPLHVWERVQFILAEKLWGEHVTISSETMDGVRTGKFLIISGTDTFGMSQFNEQVNI